LIHFYKRERSDSIMQRIRKVGTTIRNNWKKSVFFSLASAYGVKWYMKKLSDEDYMRNLAKEALGYGSGFQGVQTPNYAVTVILNPVASGGKGRKLYEQYCAPLLHLAGIKVSLMRTEEQGQAKDIMEIMQDADAVLVAGGDGVLLETVTGLLRRKDSATVASKLPLGILPVGKTNNMAMALFQGETDNVRLMGEATMSVIRQLKKGVGVIELENQGEERRGQKLFALNHVNLGAWTDSQRRENRYWVFGPLKRYLAYIGSYLTGHQEVGWSCDMALKYSQELQEEDSLGTEAPTVTAEASSQGVLSWLTGKPSASVTPNKPPKEVTWLSRPFTGAEINITPNQEENLLVKLSKGNLEFSEFVSHGVHLVERGQGRGQPVESETLETGSIFLTPGEAAKDRLFNVDGEEVEFNDPVKVSYLKDKIVMFCKNPPSSGDVGSQVPKVTSGRWSLASNFTPRKHT